MYKNCNEDQQMNDNPGLLFENFAFIAKSLGLYTCDIPF